MKFEDITYVKRTGRHGITLGIYINGRNFVPKFRLVQMREHALMVIDELDWSKPKSAKAFYDIDYWKYFKIGKKLALGRSLRYLADHDMLPIRCINREKKSTKLYERIWPAVVDSEVQAEIANMFLPRPRRQHPDLNWEGPTCLS